MLFVSDAHEYSFPSHLPYTYMVCAIVAMPVLEEMFCRAVLLKSLKSRMPQAFAVILVSVAFSAVHPLFIEALPRQLSLCLVYLLLGDSICASILFHVTMNAVPFLPLADFLQRHHVNTIWR